MSRFSPGNPGVLLSDVEATFYDAVASANGNAANVVTASMSPATAKTTDLARHRAIAAAAVKAGLGHLGGGSRNALYELGVGGS